jgi:molybdopterin/thiamine biosynthesis adenylyltransferase
MGQEDLNSVRYDRQVRFAGLGPAGQRRLAEGRALIVGMGGLGSWVAELLARAGVGMLRLLDPDQVDLSNIHRQALYSQADAAAATAKVHAAAGRLAEINGQVTVEPFVLRLESDNIARLAGDVGVILDGTDNFATRFLINDYAVRSGTPWVFAGVVGAEAQTMTVIPGRTACLRCVMEAPPPACTEPTCSIAGVLGPAVATIAAIQACEAMKILSGNVDRVSEYLVKLDLWGNTVQRIDVSGLATRADCPCCGRRQFDYLES